MSPPRQTYAAFYFYRYRDHRDLHSFPTRRSSDLSRITRIKTGYPDRDLKKFKGVRVEHRSEEHTSELQSRGHLVCRLLLEKKNVGNEMQANVCDEAGALSGNTNSGELVTDDSRND